MFRYQNQGSSLGSLAVTVIGLLVVGVPLYFFVLRQGWSGLSAMPYAIPLAAVAFALILALGHRLTGNAGIGYVPVRRGSPAGGIFAGLLLVAGGIVMSFKAGADVHRYEADTSCTAGFAASGGAGSCSLEHVRITETYACGRHYSSSCLTLERPDGSSLRVTEDTNYRGNVHRGARDQGDRLATVQYFEGRVVQVETRSGRVATADMPAARERFWTLMGLVGGGFGLIAAFVVLLRGVF